MWFLTLFLEALRRSRLWSATQMFSVFKKLLCLLPFNVVEFKRLVFYIQFNYLKCEAKK